MKSLNNKDTKNQLTWGDVTLRQFQEIDRFETTEDTIDDMLGQLSILMEKSLEELDKLTINELTTQMSKYNFLKDVPQEKKIDVIEVGGYKFGLCNLDELTLAQFVDIESYIKNGLIQNAHKILSVLYLPIIKQNVITKKYELEPYETSEERETLLLEVGMDKIYPTLLFFYRIVKVYLTIIQLYGIQMEEETMILEGAKMKMMMKEMDEEQLKMLNTKLKSVLENNGIGMI